MPYVRTSSSSVRPMPSMVAPSTGVMAPWSNQAYEAGLRRPRAAAASTKTGKAEVRALSAPPSVPALSGAGGAAAAAVTLGARRLCADWPPARRAPPSVGRPCSAPLQSRRGSPYLAAGALQCRRASDAIQQANRIVGQRCAGAQRRGLSVTCTRSAAQRPPGSASRRFSRLAALVPIAPRRYCKGFGWTSLSTAQQAANAGRSYA